MTKYNYTFDKLKAIAALLVIINHSTYFIIDKGLNTFYNYGFYEPLLSVSVPFFLMVSGYFIALKKYDITYIRNQGKNLFILYLKYTLFYVLFSKMVLIMTNINNFDYIITNLKIYNSSYSNSNVLSGIVGKVHLWYLFAASLGYYILSLLLEKKVSITSILIFSFLVYYSDFFSIIGLHSLSNLGGAPKALFYTVVGIYVFNIIDKYEINYSGIISIFLWALYIVSSYMSMAGAKELIMILAIGFTLIYAIKNNSKQNLLSYLGSKSLNVYIMHMAIMSLFSLFIATIGLDYYAHPGIMILINTVISFLLSIPIYSLIDKLITLIIEFFKKKIIIKK